MNLHNRFVVVLFAALLVVAQQEAAVHAIGHLPELLAGADHSDDEEDSAPHKCPDCARFASISVGATAPDSPSLQPAEGPLAVVRPVLVAIANSPLARPRNRSPPQP
jgi:hypothetical protein